MGRAMEPLEGRFIFEQLYCPSCAALFVTELLSLDDSADPSDG
jgi:hypothetical protein